MFGNQLGGYHSSLSKRKYKFSLDLNADNDDSEK